jgi:hypothetical protein
MQWEELSDKIIPFLKERGWELAVSDSVRKRTRLQYVVPTSLEEGGLYRIVPIVPSRRAEELFQRDSMDRREGVVPCSFFEDDDREIMGLEINTIAFNREEMVVEYVADGDIYTSLKVPYKKAEALFKELPYNVPLSAELSEAVRRAFKGINLDLHIQRMEIDGDGESKWETLSEKEALMGGRTYLIVPEQGGRTEGGFYEATRSILEEGRVTVIKGRDRFAFSKLTFILEGVCFISEEEARFISYETLDTTLRSLQYGTATRIDHFLKGVFVLPGGGLC